jgi:hypothetical protein
LQQLPALVSGVHGPPPVAATLAGGDEVAGCVRGSAGRGPAARGLGVSAGGRW